MAITYTLKRSRRAKYMRLAVRPGGTLVVTVPYRLPESVIGTFVSSHAQWIERSIARMSSFKVLPVSGRRDYLKHKEAARAFVRERVQYWNQVYAFSYNRIAIKNTRRVWGSCSRKGNLNFSYALMFLPRELADYVVVHELCHLQEHNHGANFWKLVSRAQPQYRERRRELRRYTPNK